VVRWEEKEIIRSLIRRGFRVRSIDPRTFPFDLYNDLKDLDIFIQRTINRSLALATSMLLEIMGYQIINTGFSTFISQNKSFTLAKLYRDGIPVPRSFMVYEYDSMAKAVDMLGFPVVHKPVTGSWGKLITLVKDIEELRMISEYKDFINDPSMRISLVQEFIDKGDRDIRITVVGDHAYAPIYRVNNDHWITNTARGGKAVPAKLDPDLEDISIRAAKSVGVEIAGVDVFETRDRGYIVNEINPVPEFKNVVRVTNVRILIFSSNKLNTSSLIKPSYRQH
jgi:[lysine-biosynthesis-protein LysW]--L-2-aminoadipate ligase